MDKNEECNDGILRCPLCGSEEYLLSDSNTLICANCGCLIENVDQVSQHSTKHKQQNSYATFHGSGLNH